MSDDAERLVHVRVDSLSLEGALAVPAGARGVVLFAHGSVMLRPEPEAMTLFSVGEEVNHRVGDPQCPECWEEYPEPCRCGGLMHAAASAEEDADGNVVLVTCCDACGRSEDQLDEV